jgi:hypothetical protein
MLVPCEIAIDSLSVIESAPLLWILDVHMIRQPANMEMYPILDWAASLSQSAVFGFPHQQMKHPRRFQSPCSCLVSELVPCSCQIPSNPPDRSSVNILWFANKSCALMRRGACYVDSVALLQIIDLSDYTAKAKVSAKMFRCCIPQ